MKICSGAAIGIFMQKFTAVLRRWYFSIDSVSKPVYSSYYRKEKGNLLERKSSES